MNTTDFQSRLAQIITMLYSNQISSYSSATNLDGLLILEIDNRIRETFNSDGKFIQREPL